jgi:hypothetical protein
MKINLIEIIQMQFKGKKNYFIFTLQPLRSVIAIKFKYIYKTKPI